MATKSSIAMRRFTVCAFTLLLSSLYLCARAEGQQGASPLVTSSAITGLDHPAGWGTIYQTALDQQGDWLVVDYGKGALYEFPAGGGAEVTLIPTGGLGGGNNPGIAIDSNNTLYLEGNWSNCLLRFPYDSATKTWPGIATFNTNNQSSNCPAPHNFAQYSALNGANGQAYWNWGFQPWGLAVDADNNIVAANQTDSNFMFYLNVVGTGSSASEGAYDILLKTMVSRASSVAIDPWHNVYFVEEPDQSPANGIFVLPATVSGLPTALGITNALADEKSLTNLAPNLPATVGVATDTAGNIYASDNTLGTYLIPNVAGTPTPSAAILLTTLSGQGAVAVDSVRHIMYAPTNTVQSNGRADVAQVNFETAEFGSSPAGTAISTPVSVSYAFNGNVTPARFVIVEDGKTAPDFAVVSDGTCAVGTIYPIPATSSGSQVNNCNINVTATPQTAGNVSAQLLMQTAATVNKQTIYTTAATTVLHASGMAGAAQTSPALEAIS